jgi:hypothetical protein
MLSYFRGECSPWSHFTKRLKKIREAVRKSSRLHKTYRSQNPSKGREASKLQSRRICES